MSQDDLLIKKIEDVLAKFPAVARSWYKSQRMYGHFEDRVGHSSLAVEVSALADHIYGPNHDTAKSIKGAITSNHIAHLERAEGMLRGTIAAIGSGLLVELRTAVLLDVQTDFIDAARQALGSGAKDVAAALLCIVLEDSTKRLAVKHNLHDLIDKEYSVVVVGLFKAGAISKATKGNLLAQKDLRNSTLHAQWHEVSNEAVSGLLYFLPSFIEQHGV